MGFTCCTGFGALSKAAAKYASAIVRRAGSGAVHPDWAARATQCEQCPLRFLAGKVSYCGRPFHWMPTRDDAQDGCGCPTRDKARDPGEHCPLTVRNLPSRTGESSCDCKWCAGLPTGV